MFQSFDAPTTPDQGPPRLRALRASLPSLGVDAVLVPRADAHQGENVAPCDERLSWLTGFTGSAGTAVVTATEAAIFVDGRYALQVRDQVADCFIPVRYPDTKPAAWLSERLPGGTVGIDPWLHTSDEITALTKAGLSVRAIGNPVDALWTDRPARPARPARPFPEMLSGESATGKRTRIAAVLRDAGQSAAVLTLPDSIAWLLNIRGADIARTPTVLAFAILHDDGRVGLFVDPSTVEPIAAHLGPDVSVHAPASLEGALSTLGGPVRVDPASAPWAVARILEAAGIDIAWAEDPCLRPKARKTPAEIAGMEQAHLRDAAAMIEFLCWFDRTAPDGTLTEIAVVEALEGFRRDTGVLDDISFDTICGAGPNGAIVHYRVTRDTDRAIAPGDLVLIDSGAQYPDGTTDITRTVTTGTPTADQIDAFTRVLRGMIAISRVRFPRGLAGRDLDPLARAALWMAGQDYDHGTGHGVGAALSVHEGPQRLSRISEVPLEPGMILSNEPGYYRAGAWGIRIENLIVVETAPELGDGRDQLCFSTLTWVPIDRRLVDAEALSSGERAWLDAYHAEVRDRIGPLVSDDARAWLVRATEAV